MGQRYEPINAILYAQFHLRGGTKNTLIGVGLALLLVGGGCVMAVSLDPTHTRDVGRAAVATILVLQIVLLGLYGTSRVSAAVRQDVTSGLIESHRLTPNSPIAAAAGYVIGPAYQAIALATVLVVVGLVMCLLAQYAVTYWLVANGMILALAVLLWTLVALISFTVTNAAVLPILAACTFLSASLFMLLPALAVISAPLGGQSVFSITSGTKDLPIAYAFTLVSQGLLGGVLLLALSRRYRNADTAAFSVSLAMLLLGIWTAITIVGLSQAELFLPRFLYRSGDSPERLIAGLAASYLLALVPITAIARGIASSSAGGRLLFGWLLVVACAFVAYAPAAVEFVAPDRHAATRHLGTFAVALSMFAGLTFLLAWQFLAGRAGWAMALLYVLLPNALPPLANAILHINDVVPDPNISPLTAAGPLAALIVLWGDRPADALPGVAAQALLVTLPAAAYVLRRRRLTLARQPGFAVQPTPTSSAM